MVAAPGDGWRARSGRAETLRAGGGRARRKCAGAFSILEILIAISLMALLAGLVIPISIGAIARASALEAQPRLEAAVAQARLEAARLSAPVRLAAAGGGAAVRIEALEITRENADAGVTPLPGGAAGDLLGPVFQEAPGAAGGPAAGEWVLLDEILLPEGIVLEPRSEAEGLGAGALSVFTMSSSPGEESAVDGEASDAKPWVFATALPDGRLEAGGDVIVRAAARGDSDEARWSVQFAAWTGGVTLTPVRPDQEEEGFAEGDALPPPPPAGDSGPGGGARDAGTGGER